jgi:uncharacterized protein involved in type VI secretion and phage assembly
MLPYTETELEWLQAPPTAGRHQEPPRIARDSLEQYTAEARRLRAQAFARMFRALARTLTGRSQAAATERAPARKTTTVNS